ncbi:hypothetical protein pdam_00004340 [Pocillopora damicornis]|uniref:FAD-dependent oxidoreductase domain-containing protein 1 n=1 Tax=Pocillopora damicornis TaxID=46731 RepID=A0A3M6UIY7_POCDA|nr:hypothetical protein pdam_00004340 [Pocillopora damicornis]
MAAGRKFLRTILSYPPKTRSIGNFLKLQLTSIRCLSSNFLVKYSKSSKRFSSNKQNVYDVAIVGGGAIGSSSAYFLASKMQGQGKICVIECDPTGYLFLASKEGEERMKENHVTQRELGCEVILLSPSELSERFPWLNTDGISLASLGTGREGWFDPWSLLNAYKRKAISLNVDYITGEAVDFVTDQNGQICSIKVVTSSSSNDPQTIHCRFMVNAAGVKAGYLARKLGIYLPVEPRKRCVFVLSCPGAPNKHQMPLIVDTTGCYIRPESGSYLKDIETSDFEVDYDFFYEAIWPKLAHRIPLFECIKVQSAWAGHYEYNTLDQNCIIGRHPQIRNLIFVNGFSGHGIQQSPAAGRAVSELIMDGGFQTIDLSALGYERVLSNEPMKEKNIV